MAQNCALKARVCVSIPAGALVRAPAARRGRTSELFVSRTSTSEMTCVPENVLFCWRDILQSWVHRFAFQRQHAEDGFMNAAQWFFADKSFERFDAKREFAESQGSFF
jgi:hypothetical protein